MCGTCSIFFVFVFGNGSARCGCVGFVEFAELVERLYLVICRMDGNVLNLLNGGTGRMDKKRMN